MDFFMSYNCYLCLSLLQTVRDELTISMTGSTHALYPMELLCYSMVPLLVAYCFDDPEGH
jgi:hypothetical protein